MNIDILTLFPEMFVGPFEESILKRARSRGRVQILVHNLRNWAIDKHKTVDDKPYGGGPGMILKVDVIDRALTDLESKNKKQESIKILLSAKGERYKQQKAVSFSKYNHLILLCGHYEGVDHRVTKLVDEVVSIGDFVLTGGEIASMVVVDSVVRLIPGVLGHDDSSKDDSFKEDGYIEYPQYTRPETYKKMGVPKVLLSGDHGRIAKWRKKKSKKKI